MTEMFYVLSETEQNGSGMAIGVFDSPDISDGKLRDYYGSDMEVLQVIDIRDSGLEWQKRIQVDGITCVLTLHYFELNEL